MAHGSLVAEQGIPSGPECLEHRNGPAVALLLDVLARGGCEGHAFPRTTEVGGLEAHAAESHGREVAVRRVPGKVEGLHIVPLCYSMAAGVEGHVAGQASELGEGTEQGRADRLGVARVPGAGHFVVEDPDGLVPQVRATVRLVQLSEVRRGGPDGLDVSEADVAPGRAGLQRCRRSGHGIERRLGERGGGEARADQEVASSHVLSGECGDRSSGAGWGVRNGEALAPRRLTVVAAQPDVLDGDLVAESRGEGGGDQLRCGWVRHPSTHPVRHRALVVAEPHVLGRPAEPVHLVGQGTVGDAALRNQRLELSVSGHVPAPVRQHCGRHRR